MNTWKTATPDLSASEGIEMILDQVAADAADWWLSPEGGFTSRYAEGFLDGVESCLATLLAADERPAREVVMETIAKVKEEQRG